MHFIIHKYVSMTLLYTHTQNIACKHQMCTQGQANQILNTASEYKQFLCRSCCGEIECVCFFDLLSSGGVRVGSSDVKSVSKLDTSVASVTSGLKGGSI